LVSGAQQAKHNQIDVGVYANVLGEGTIQRGDPVRVV
jgi:MOSC domain-containing protein YiiM